ncbi:DUF4339 domain-containing protein [Rhodoferax sp. 4810]|nr:DUF4339 domain-containing protein [Rhodoferax jenense]
MDHDNFFSIDRMVEFGLGMAVAKQMTESMNLAMQNTHIPGLNTPMIRIAPKFYHAMLDEKAAGPFTEQEMSRLITEGRLTKNTYVWHPGMAKWETIENVPDVLKLVALAPPPFKP